MGNQLFPQVVEAQNFETSVQMILQVDEEISYFRGHFDSFAILPGVALISWVVHYSTEYLRTSENSIGLDQIKFLKPIVPDSRIHLQIESKSEKIEFVCTNGTEKMASGRILLGPA